MVCVMTACHTDAGNRGVLINRFKSQNHLSLGNNAAKQGLHKPDRLVIGLDWWKAEVDRYINQVQFPDHHNKHLSLCCLTSDQHPNMNISFSIVIAFLGKSTKHLQFFIIICFVQYYIEKCFMMKYINSLILADFFPLSSAKSLKMRILFILRIQHCSLFEGASDAQ